MRIKSVTIEGMHNVEKKTYEFNQLNYLHGCNGAGKSTVLQAVQLALLGYIPGMNKTKESIFNNSNSHTMAVTVVVEGDSQPILIRRVWTTAGKSVNSTVSISPDGYDIQSIVGNLELPIFNFNEFVGMTANKLKDWFIGFLPSASGEIDWEKELAESAKAINIVDEQLIPHSVTQITCTPLKGVDQVRAANEYFKSTLSFKKQELQRLQSTIQSLVYYDDCENDLNVDDIKEEIRKLSETKNIAIQCKAIQDRNSKIYAELSKLELRADCAENDPKYIELKKKYEGCEDAILSIRERMSKLHEKHYTLNDKKAEIAIYKKFKEDVINSGGVCQYTKESCPSILNMIENLKREISELNKSVKNYDIEIDDISIKLKELATSSDAQSTERSRLHSDMEHIKEMYSRKEMLQNQIESIANVDLIDTDIESIEVKIQELSDMLIKIAANQRYTQLTDNLTNQKFEIEQSIEALKLWDKLTSANGLQTKMMNEPFVEFIGKMNKFIKPLFGEDTSAEFNLIQKANSFSFGIERNNAYIPYDLLSSGEKCMFMLALMICIVDDSSSLLKLVMVDDLLDHLDDENIIKLFHSLNEVSNIQFILAGVKTVGDNKFNESVIEVK